MPQTQLRCAVYIDKGGVSKTTSVGHIGRAMAGEHDLDTLIIDAAGRQNDVATLFGLNDNIDDIDAPLSAVFRDDWEFIRSNIDDVVDMMVFETNHPNLDVIPSDPGIEGADNNLANVDREQRFHKLQQFIDEDLQHYDAILFDLPGKESNIALNGLVAAENVVAPVKPGEFERQQLGKLQQVFDDFTADLPGTVALDLVMVLPAAVDTRKSLHQEFLDDVEDAYPDLVADAHINDSADVERSPELGNTVFDVPDDELYTTGKRARDAYSSVTDDLITRLKQ